MNTVAVNEAAVLHYAQLPEFKGKVSFVGCNPGLIAHSGPGGLRDQVHGGGWLGAIIEGALSLFMQSADAYAGKMLLAMLSPDIAAHSGVLLGSGATPILPARVFSADAGKASAVFSDASKLLDEALAGKIAT